MSTQPVICDNCKKELTNYRDIADSIREAVDGKIGEVALEALLRIIMKAPGISPSSLNTLSLGLPEIIQVKMARRRRQVINIVHYPCPHCKGYYRWKRKSK